MATCQTKDGVKYRIAGSIPARQYQVWDFLPKKERWGD